MQKEEHFGADVWVTRKGAVRAGKGELGIIPGSMGCVIHSSLQANFMFVSFFSARSYIVKGLGNAESFESCSHGAGR